jgi:V8-like Glu-specific endopeptidase
MVDGDGRDFDPEAPLGPKFWSTGPVDDRRRVRDTTIRPLSSICRLSAPGRLFGTGTVIAPRVILTAGHNLTAGIRWAIDQAYNHVPHHEPLKGGRSVPHPAWAAERDPHYDVGLLFLDEDAPTAFAPSVVTAAHRDARIYVSGYSRDDPNFQRYDLGGFTGSNGTLAGHTCDTAPGQSGSPVIAYDDKGSRLIGIHVYGYSDLRDFIPGNVNKTVLLVPEIFEWIEHTLAGQEVWA